MLFTHTRVGQAAEETHDDGVKAVLPQSRHVLELGVSRADWLVDGDLGALLGAEEQVLRQVEREGHLANQNRSSRPNQKCVCRTICAEATGERGGLS